MGLNKMAGLVVEAETLYTLDEEEQRNLITWLHHAVELSIRYNVLGLGFGEVLCRFYFGLFWIMSDIKNFKLNDVLLIKKTR